MKGEDFSGVTSAVASVARNGALRTMKKSIPAPRGAAGGSGARAPLGSTAQLEPQVIDATSAKTLATTFVKAEFVTAEAEPVDAPMWPLHAALWLQSEMAPSIPIWTGLGIERHNRILVSDFLLFDAAQKDRPGSVDNSAFPSGKNARSSPACLDLPESGLTPLGWNPRAVCRKDGDV